MSFYLSIVVLYGLVLLLSKGAKHAQNRFIKDKRKLQQHYGGSTGFMGVWQTKVAHLGKLAAGIRTSYLQEKRLMKR